MSYNIIPTHRFEKELKRLVKKFPSLKSEFTRLIADISEKPETGTFIGNICFKIRLAIVSKSKGKRGGARWLPTLSERVYLLTVYDKGEKADLKSNELKEMVESLELGCKRKTPTNRALSRLLTSLQNELIKKYNPPRKDLHKEDLQYIGLVGFEYLGSAKFGNNNFSILNNYRVNQIIQQFRKQFIGTIFCPPANNFVRWHS